MAEVAQPMTDNEALVAILEAVRELEGNLFGDYEVEGVSEEVATDAEDEDRELTREANEDALKTVVVASGAAEDDGNVSIYENDVLVAVIHNTTWESPLAGTGEIKAVAGASANTVSLQITTFVTPTE